MFKIAVLILHTKLKMLFLFHVLVKERSKEGSEIVKTTFVEEQNAKNSPTDMKESSHNLGKFPKNGASVSE